MKSLTFVTLLVASVVLLSAAVCADNVTWGNIGPYDRLLARDIVEKSSKWFGKHKEIITYPPKGHETFARISAIRVLDNGGPKDFGTATLIQGGPGANTATIQVKSQSRRGIKMIIEYYGLPN